MHNDRCGGTLTVRPGRFPASRARLVYPATFALLPMPSDDAWTVGRLLQWTADYLQAHRSESPRLDAEVLLAHALGCQRIELYTSFDEVPGEEIRGAFRELVRRRAEGMPVAYLVGQREFYSLSFRVTPDVLIPRPETELLVIAALDLARQEGSGEGGQGSGRGGRGEKGMAEEGLLKFAIPIPNPQSLIPPPIPNP